MGLWTGRWPLAGGFGVLAVLLACGDDGSKDDKDDKDEESEDGDEAADLVPDGTEALASGDFTAAKSAYQDYAEEEGSTAVEGATGLAWLEVLEDDFDGALEVLESARDEASEEEERALDLRMALVQVRAGRLDDYPDKTDLESGKMVQGATSLAESSELPEGWLIAGEIHLADAERGPAADCFKKALEGEGLTAEVAQQYLDLLESEISVVRDLSEATANWAVGNSSPPISTLKEQAIEDFVQYGLELSETPWGSSEQMLVWAGRAASIRDVERAKTILSWATDLPEEHAWRYTATEGIIQCADGLGRKCVTTFQKVQGMDPPPDGYRDASATAAFLLAEIDPRRAEQLVGDSASSAPGLRAMIEAYPCKSTESSDAPGLLGEYTVTRDDLEERCF